MTLHFCSPRQLVPIIILLASNCIFHFLVKKQKYFKRQSWSKHYLVFGKFKGATVQASLRNATYSSSGFTGINLWYILVPGAVSSSRGDVFSSITYVSLKRLMQYTKQMHNLNACCMFFILDFRKHNSRKDRKKIKVERRQDKVDLTRKPYPWGLAFIVPGDSMESAGGKLSTALPSSDAHELQQWPTW